MLTLQGNQQVALLRHNPITKVSSTLCCRILSIKVNYAILRQQISLHDKRSNLPCSHRICNLLCPALLGSLRELKSAISAREVTCPRKASAFFFNTFRRIAVYSLRTMNYYCYLLFQDTNQKIYYIPDASNMPSQLFRKCLAPHLAAPCWNWKNETYIDNMMRTMALFKRNG